MISKEKFVEIINRLREVDDIKTKIREIYRKATDNQKYDFMNAGSLMIAHEDLVVELLVDSFGLNKKDNALNYWLNEREYGRTFKIGDVEHTNGYKPDLTTPEKLYDYLVEEGKLNEQS